MSYNCIQHDVTFNLLFMFNAFLLKINVGSDISNLVGACSPSTSTIDIINIYHVNM